MGKRIVGFFILFIIFLAAAPEKASAQDFFPRLFRTGKYRHYNCKIDAYNKKAAYRKHKRSRSNGKKTKLVARQSKQETTSKEKLSQANPPAKPTRPPGKATPKKSSPTRTPPGNDTPGQKLTPGTETPPLLAKVPPKAPKKADTSIVVNRKVTHLTREMLKKMTLQERRDTLERTPPTIVLPPIQFISDQDEFSVVNMDSFMQAMEYAQQGKVVLIEGHTDDLGSEAYNLKLSMKRAEKIRQLLLSGDVSDELISVIGYGEAQPVVPNTSDENRAKNRRIEFKVFSLSE